MTTTKTRQLWTADEDASIQSAIVRAKNSDDFWDTFRNDPVVMALQPNRTRIAVEFRARRLMGYQPPKRHKPRFRVPVLAKLPKPASVLPAPAEHKNGTNGSTQQAEITVKRTLTIRCIVSLE